MEKIVNINKAPKDDVLNKIMQEIDDEKVSANDTRPPKSKKTPKIKKSPKIKKNPKKKSWTQWLVNFIFLMMVVVFLFALVLIFKATEEVTRQEVVSVEKVESNSSVSLEENLSKTTPLVKTKTKKVPDNLIIFDMRAKKSDITREQAPYVALEKVRKIEKPLTEREKAKALLKEQMNF